MGATRNPVVVVCGATGKQGGGVVDALQALGDFDVRALVRDLERAQGLVARGAQLVRGDFLDKGSLIEAFEGADLVFGVTQPWKPGARKADAKAEVEQGKAIVDACKQAGATLVLSTQIHADDKPTGLPHGDSKLEIEAYATAQGLPLVNVRPASFLDNIGSEWFPVRKGRVQGLADGDAKLPYIATRDIGRCVAAVMARLPEHIGRHLDLVTGLYSGDDIAYTLSRIRGGEPFRYTAPPKLVMRLFFKEFYLMRIGFEKAGRPPILPALAKGLKTTSSLIDNPMTLEGFLRQQGYPSKPLK
jgi:uncharacterized protein YbjT (DUF2867 family)